MVAEEHQTSQAILLKTLCGVSPHLQISCSSYDSEPAKWPLSGPSNLCGSQASLLPSLELGLRASLCVHSALKGNWLGKLTARPLEPLILIPLPLSVKLNQL